jgi:hypothetical protein
MDLRKIVNNLLKNKRRTDPFIDPAVLKQFEIRLLKLEGNLDKAVSGYRLMLIKNNPDLLPELITGDSIERLDSSLLKARDLTVKIKEKLEIKAAAERIPEGSPVRTPPDTGSMSPEEKIRYGLEVGRR